MNKKTHLPLSFATKFLVRFDFARSYILAFTLFLVLANDWNEIVGKITSTDFFVSWIISFVFILVGASVFAFFIVDVLKIKDIYVIENNELNPFYHGQLTPNQRYYLKHVYLPLMKSQGCGREEIEVVEKAIRKRDWR